MSKRVALYKCRGTCFGRKRVTSQAPAGRLLSGDIKRLRPERTVLLAEARQCISISSNVDHSSSN